MNATIHDPDRDGTEDPGSSPNERREILNREVAALQHYRRRG